MRKLTVEELCRMDVTAFRAAEKLPLVVVLDNVRSLHNVGSVFRTADAFRLAGVWLCGITACPPPAEIHKTALEPKTVCPGLIVTTRFRPWNACVRKATLYWP